MASATLARVVARPRRRAPPARPRADARPPPSSDSRARRAPPASSRRVLALGAAALSFASLASRAASEEEEAKDADPDPDPSSGGLLPRAPSTLRELVDPTRDAAMMAGAYAGPPTEYAEEDPDGALRRAICPRNPTADVCRSAKDRKRVNDSPCKVPLLNACLVWKEGKGNEQIVLRGRGK
jgi:hypothetical protein